MVNDAGTYIVWGPPGTGKTTYLANEARDLVAWAAKWYPADRTPVLLCSLTRTAAAEIAGRDLPLSRECIGTLHSHAYRALDRPPVAESMIKEFNQAHPAYRLSGGKTDTEDPEWDRRLGSPGDELANEYHLMRAKMTNRQLWKPRVQAFAHAWESWKADADCIDFTDMIEKAWREVDFAPGSPHIIIADEAQDLSAMEFALLKRWGQACGHLIITGDPYQSLYVWRGAHPEIFLDPAVPENHKRVLSQSYRVPQLIHHAAMRWVEQLSNYQRLEYQPRDAAGQILKCTASWKAPERAVDLAESYLVEGKSVMFITSCSFFLPPVLAVLRKRGIPFGNPWRLKRGDWNPLAGRGTTMAQRIVDFLRWDIPSFGDDARPWAQEELARWVSVLQAKGLLLHGAKARIAAAGQDEEQKNVLLDMAQLFNHFEDGPLNDLLDMLVARDSDSDKENTPSMSELLAWWSERLLTTKVKASRFPLTAIKKHGVEALTNEPRCYVGTTHSFKGAEADVVIVFPDLSPAGLREWMRRGESRDSVIRLFYVAMTRARETLVLCQPGSGQCVNLSRFATATLEQAKLN